MENNLVGKTMISVTVNDEDPSNNKMTFTDNENTKYIFYHHQDGSESVHIEDVIGDLDDLVGTPILLAEERTNIGFRGNGRPYCTWTFYEFATQKGSVTVRWYGLSGGCYSESVDFRVELSDQTIKRI